MTKKEALAKQLFKYQADKPCRYGHQPWRYTQTGACIECVSGYSKKNYNDARAHRANATVGFDILTFKVPRDHTGNLKELAAGFGAICTTRPAVVPTMPAVSLNVVPPASVGILAPPYVPRHPMQPVQMPPPPII